MSAMQDLDDLLAKCLNEWAVKQTWTHQADVQRMMILSLADAMQVAANWQPPEDWRK
jgi:hypothetical protein